MSEITQSKVVVLIKFAKSDLGHIKKINKNSCKNVMKNTNQKIKFKLQN